MPSTKIHCVPTVDGSTRSVETSLDIKTTTHLDAWLLLPDMPLDIEYKHDIADVLKGAGLISYDDSCIIYDLKIENPEMVSNAAIRELARVMDITEPTIRDSAHVLTSIIDDETSSTVWSMQSAILFFCFTQDQIARIVHATIDMMIAAHRARVAGEVIYTWDRLGAIRGLPLNDLSDILKPENIGVAVGHHRVAEWCEMIRLAWVRCAAHLWHKRDVVNRLMEILSDTHDEERRQYLVEMINHVNSLNISIQDNLLKRPRDRKRARRILRRSIDAYRTLFGKAGMHEIKAFVSNESLIIKGARYHYRIGKTLSAIETSLRPDLVHAPYAIALYSKSGERLATGCIYFKDTPVIDQLIALRLHVQHPDDEIDFLQQCNLSNLTRAFWRDPLLPELKKDTLPKTWEIINPLAHYDLLCPLEGDMFEQPHYRHIHDEAAPLVRDELFKHLMMPRLLFNFMCDPPITLYNLQKDEMPNSDFYTTILTNVVNYFGGDI